MTLYAIQHPAQAQACDALQPCAGETLARSTRSGSSKGKDEGKGKRGCFGRLENPA